MYFYYIFFVEINTFNLQQHIKLIKSDSKAIFKCCSFEPSKKIIALFIIQIVSKQLYRKCLMQCFTLQIVTICHKVNDFTVFHLIYA